MCPFALNHTASLITVALVPAKIVSALVLAWPGRGPWKSPQLGWLGDGQFSDAAVLHAVLSNAPQGHPRHALDVLAATID